MRRSLKPLVHKKAEKVGMCYVHVLHVNLVVYVAFGVLQITETALATDRFICECRDNTFFLYNHTAVCYM